MGRGKAPKEIDPEIVAQLSIVGVYACSGIV